MKKKLKASEYKISNHNQIYLGIYRKSARTSLPRR